jgi:capsular exopolysaccharide synthesis family protein
MVIEKALEKLKQANADNLAKGGRSPERGASARPDYRTVHGPAAYGPAPVDPTIERPVFAQLHCNRDLAAHHHILLPGTPLAADGRLGAAYRMIRTRLQNLITTNGWTTLAITSPEAGEGKSVTSINLALSFARDGSKTVFLIDLDMRNPSICHYLGVQPPQSLVDYFAGECGPENLFFSIGSDNLAVAGTLASTDLASELLAGDRLERLFAYVRSIASNALIIIDLPPTLVTDEALMIAPRVDATLLVVADGQTRRDSLLRARQLLSDFSSAGVVLNKSTESIGKAGYYYGYGGPQK